MLHESHISAAKASLGDHGILAKVSSQISNITQDLLQIIDAAIVLREVSPRTLDIIISKGEILSCHLIVAVLHDRGVDARLVDLSNITPTEAPPDVNRAFYAAHVAALKPLLAEYKFCVPVITGFFGPVPGGLLGRVGRGYTDLCAALVAISLSASELQIYKEVDGICSADPRKVATAKLLPTITPAEATQLTFFGSEVLHPDTLEQIVSQNIPIRIKNTTKPVSAGTLVVPRPILETCDPKEMTDSPMLSKNKTKTWGSEHLKYPTAITSKDQILIINVQSNKRIGLAGYLAGIFTILARWHLFCDMVSVTETNVSLAFHCHHKYLRGKDEELEIVDAGLKGAVDELSELGKVTFFDNMAIVSLVGEDLKNMVGITGKMTGVLGEHNINIRMIAQGTISDGRLDPDVTTKTDSLQTSTRSTFLSLLKDRMQTVL